MRGKLKPKALGFDQQQPCGASAGTAADNHSICSTVGERRPRYCSVPSLFSVHWPFSDKIFKEKFELFRLSSEIM